MALMRFIRSVPIPICGLALGLASLDSFLFWQFSGYTFRICAWISLFLILLFTIRAVTDVDGIRNDLNNPALFGVMPTYTMTLMLLSSFAYGHFEMVSLTIWFMAVMLSFVLMFFFVRKFILRFDIMKVIPSWFVIFVGYVVAAVTAPVFGMEELGRILFCSGFMFYIILLPLILYRVVVVGNIPEQIRPNIAIFAAPINLCIVGYMASFDTYNETMLMIMAIFGIVSYISVILYMPKMLTKKFYPSIAAFTFPLVISTTSMFKLGEYFELSSTLFSVLSWTVAAIAIVVVAYVLVRFLLFMYENVRVKDAAQ